MATFLNLDELLSKYSNGYADPTQTWDAVFNDLLSDPIEKETVETLVEELKRNGQFRKPITVSPDDDDDTLTVWNGHHRLLAHKIVGNKEVKVQYGWADEDIADAISYLELSVVFLNPVSEDDIGTIFGSTRSFKANNDLWFEANHACSGGMFHMSFLDEENFNNKDIIIETVKERLEKFLPHNPVLTLEAKIEQLP